LRPLERSQKADGYEQHAKTAALSQDIDNAIIIEVRWSLEDIG